MPDRIRVARTLGAVLGALGVALIGLLAMQLLGRTAGLVVMGLAAVYVPSILVERGDHVRAAVRRADARGARVGASISAARRIPTRSRVLAGLLAGLAVLTRANGLILLVPLVLAVCGPRRGGHGVRPGRPPCWSRWRSPRSRRGRSATRSSCTPSSRSPRSSGGRWRAPTTTRRATTRSTRVPGARCGASTSTSRWWRTSRPSRRSSWSGASAAPAASSSAGTRATSRPSPTGTPAACSTSPPGDGRATPPRRSASTPAGRMPASSASGSSRRSRSSGATRRATRQVPWFVWRLPLAMYLSVIFLAAETPRYRAPLDPFIVLLAAIAVTRRRSGG